MCDREEETRAQEWEDCGRWGVEGGGKEKIVAVLGEDGEEEK